MDGDLCLANYLLMALSWSDLLAALDWLLSSVYWLNNNLLFLDRLCSVYWLNGNILTVLNLADRSSIFDW